MHASQPKVTLQINLAPSDYRHAREILPHQLRTLADQVNEVMLVLDVIKGHGPRFAGWTDGVPALERLLSDLCAEYPHARVVKVDYSPGSAEALAGALFGGRRVPVKDWAGTAVYPYFFGLWAASHDHVFHLDSDMMFGGASHTWVAEAVELLARRPEVLACNPLPGPPTPDGALRSQVLDRERSDTPAYRAPTISTRLFLIDRGRLLSSVGAIEVTQPPAHRRWQARVEGRPPYDLAEVMLTRAMVSHGLVRVDFLGSSPGLWSLHPPFRSQRFYDELPSLIARIESGDIPDQQRGDHDLNDSMIDWSDARPTNWRRVRLHAGLMGSTLLDTLLARRAGTADG